MQPARRARLVLGTGLAAALDLACTQLNPAFLFADTGEDGSGDAVPDPIDDGTTGTLEPTTGTSAEDVGSGTGAADVTGTTGSDAVVSTGEDPGGSTGPDTTGEPALEVLDLPADAATCVLLPNLIYPLFAGPDECETRVELISAYTGGMLVDTSFIGAGNGRPAQVYLRFPVPGELASATLVGAALTLHVADFADAGGLDGGVLVTTAPFLPGDLAQTAPQQVPGLQVPLGAAADGETRVLEVPLDLLEPGAAVHLGVFPTSDDGVVFAGNSAEGPLRPTLTLSYYP